MKKLFYNFFPNFIISNTNRRDENSITLQSNAIEILANTFAYRSKTFTAWIFYILCKGFFLLWEWKFPEFKKH